MSGLPGVGFCRQLGSQFNEPLSGIGTAVQDDVLDNLQLVGGYIVVSNFRGGIDDAEVHTLLDGVVEEDGMHGLADVVVAAERERQVTDTAADVGAGQVLVYPTGSADEVGSIAVVLLHTRSNGQYIGVEDNIERIHANALGQNPICTLGNLNTTLIARGLTLFVEAHHDDGSAVAHTVAGMTDEDVLTLFQRDAIDDALALHALQALDDDIPLRGVNHDGHAGNVGLSSDGVKKIHHLLAGVQQAVVHVDVDDQGAVVHLFAGYRDGLVVLLLLDESQELARAGHVTAFTHVGEMRDER